MTSTAQPDLHLVETPREPVTEEQSSKIFRFVRSERFLHWALAIPYVLLYSTALAMALLWNEPQPRHIRTIVSWAHRVMGLCLIVVPALVLFTVRRDWAIHLQNIRHAWSWDRDDIRWLLLAPRAAVDRRVRLPDQGKFNAAEKLNFMMVSVSSFVFIGTGVAVWLPGVALYAWYAHCVMAVIGIPLVAGHIIMATLNPSTRVGLEGMITGWVDREWGKHHYRRWYRERFEVAEPGSGPRDPREILQRPALVRCGSCLEVNTLESWETLLQRVFRTDPMFCPRCDSEITLTTYERDADAAEAILRVLETSAGVIPIEGRARSAAASAPATASAPAAETASEE